MTNNYLFEKLIEIYYKIMSRIREVARHVFTLKE